MGFLHGLGSGVASGVGAAGRLAGGPTQQVPEGADPQQMIQQGFARFGMKPKQPQQAPTSPLLSQVMPRLGAQPKPMQAPMEQMQNSANLLQSPQGQELAALLQQIMPQLMRLLGGGR